MRSVQGPAAPALAAAGMVITVLGAVASTARAAPNEADAGETMPDTQKMLEPAPVADTDTGTGTPQESTSTDQYRYELAAPQIVHVYDMKKGLCRKADRVAQDGMQFEVLGTVQNNAAASCDKDKYYCSDDKKLLLLKTHTPQHTFGQWLASFGTPAAEPQKPATSGPIDSRQEGQYLCIDKNTFDELKAEDAITKKYRRGYSGAVYGLNLTLPIKIRPAISGFNTSLSQNIEIGGLLGWRWRLSQTLDYHIDVPVVTLGLANLQIEKGRAPAAMDTNAQSMGITASTGIILELNDFQLGLMAGVDRATGDAGRGWVYNGKVWYAFGLGYSFLKNSPK